MFKYSGASICSVRFKVVPLLSQTNLWIWKQSNCGSLANVKLFKNVEVEPDLEQMSHLTPCMSSLEMNLSRQSWIRRGRPSTGILGKARETE